MAVFYSPTDITTTKKAKEILFEIISESKFPETEAIDISKQGARGECGYAILDGTDYVYVLIAQIKNRQLDHLYIATEATGTKKTIQLFNSHSSKKAKVNTKAYATKLNSFVEHTRHRYNGVRVGKNDQENKILKAIAKLKEIHKKEQGE